jgi:hypothetical protein
VHNKSQEIIKESTDTQVSSASKQVWETPVLDSISIEETRPVFVLFALRTPPAI